MLMSSVQCAISNFECAMRNTQCAMCNVQYVFQTRQSPCSGCRSFRSPPSKKQKQKLGDATAFERWLHASELDAPPSADVHFGAAALRDRTPILLRDDVYYLQRAALPVPQSQHAPSQHAQSQHAQSHAQLSPTSVLHLHVAASIHMLDEVSSSWMHLDSCSLIYTKQS
jgi:hypothetical protein